MACGFVGVENPRTAALSPSTILVGGDSRYPTRIVWFREDGAAARPCWVSRVFPMVPPFCLPRPPQVGCPKRPGISFHPRTSSLQHTLGAEGQSSSTIVSKFSKRFHHRIVLSSRRYLFHALYCSLVFSLYPLLRSRWKKAPARGTVELGTFGTILHLAIWTNRPRQ